MANDRRTYFTTSLRTADDRAYIGYGFTVTEAEEDALQCSRDKGGPESFAEFVKVDTNKMTGPVPQMLRDSKG